LIRLILRYFLVELEPEANEKRKTEEAAKHNGEKAGWGGKGTAAGVQVSAATQRTCTSDSGTDACTTSSPRHNE